MPPNHVVVTPGLSSFLKSLKTSPIEPSIEHLSSLLKRRQIRNSRPCAIATTALLLRVVGEFRGRDPEKMISRIKEVGKRLTAAQPREMVVGNIVRRVLGLVREVLEDQADAEASASEVEHRADDHNNSLARPSLSSSLSTFSPLKHSSIVPAQLDGAWEPESMASSGELPSKRPSLMQSHTSFAPAGSLFGLFQHPDTPSPSSTPTNTHSPSRGLPDMSGSKVNLKAEVLDGIREIQDELEQSDELIAQNALDHIHSNEIILTTTASTTVQKFLLAAARKRKFTVVHAEPYPNDHHDTQKALLTGQKRDHPEDDEDDRFKSLTAAGIQVVLIPDSHVFAIMSRVNKVILATHCVLANGALIAAAGARMIAKAAKVHKVPVIIASGIYKLSPVYPFDVDQFIEYGDASKVVSYEDGELVDRISVENPIYDYVPASLVDLYITNLGGHAPSYLYRIVADHYRVEDVNL